MIHVWDFGIYCFVINVVCFWIKCLQMLQCWCTIPGILTYVYKLQSKLKNKTSQYLHGFLFAIVSFFFIDGKLLSVLWRIFFCTWDSSYRVKQKCVKESSGVLQNLAPSVKKTKRISLDFDTRFGYFKSLLFTSILIYTMGPKRSP